MLYQDRDLLAMLNQAKRRRQHSFRNHFQNCRPCPMKMPKQVKCFSDYCFASPKLWPQLRQLLQDPRMMYVACIQLGHQRTGV